MRKKFVQIAAFLLVLLMLPWATASAELSGEGTVDPAAEPVVETNTDETAGDGASEDADDESVTDGTENPDGDAEGGEESEDGEPTEGEPGLGDETGSETEEPPVAEPIVTFFPWDEDLIRVGLYYGNKTLPGANLLNSEGNGYRFGYDDGNGFHQLGVTNETAISMVKTQNVYYFSKLSDNLSGYTDEKTSDIAVGCIHLVLPGSYSTFEAAKAAADAVGGFPAWIKGEFQVRIGAYTSSAAAEAARQRLGIEASIQGTSVYGISVVITGTNTPIFQFDGDVDNAMFVVKPGMDDSVKTVTHFKGLKYYGSFRYERIKGGDLTVVNLVDIEDYIRGVLPYEMSPTWPLEALKAQAVCARSYTAYNENKHSKYHFDICNTIDCQVYYGTKNASAVTEQAVDETAGLYAWHNGKVIAAYYHSSDGGGTENCENVWNEAVPYLRGVVDPYEALIEDKIPGYHWSKVFTGEELRDLFRSKGFQCGKIVDLRVSKSSETGNVCSVTFTDVNGKSWTISKDGNIRSLFGANSLRYTISYGGAGYVLTDNQYLGSLHNSWVLNGNGELEQVSAGSYYALTGDGVESVSAPESSDGTFVFSGTGLGHNLGMSQWGAYAMAKEGFTYDEILKFYYTGIEIHE